MSYVALLARLLLAGGLSSNTRGAAAADTPPHVRQITLRDIMNRVDDIDRNLRDLQDTQREISHEFKELSRNSPMHDQLKGRTDTLVGLRGTEPLRGEQSDTEDERQRSRSPRRGRIFHEDSLEHTPSERSISSLSIDHDDEDSEEEAGEDIEDERFTPRSPRRDSLRGRNTDAYNPNPLRLRSGKPIYARPLHPRHYKRIVKQDIGVWGHYTDTPGWDFVCGPAAEASPSALAATKKEARAIISDLNASKAATYDNFYSGNVVDAAAQAALVHYIEQAWSKMSKELQAQHTDFKLDLTRQELTALIGRKVVRSLVTTFNGPFNQIKLRRSTAYGQCINFHLDHSQRTMAVPLNSGEDYVGGQLVYATIDGLWQPNRLPGSALIHDNTVPHGVTKLISGIRYGLFFLQTA